MELYDLLHLECVKVPLDHSGKKAAIDELVDLITPVHGLRDPEAIKTAVWEREQTRTTGIGQGLAIPHCKSPACEDHLLMAIGKPAEPIDFQAIDGLPVRLIILLASPPDRTSEHIQILAQVSRMMLNDEFRAAAYEAKNAEALYSLFARRGQPTQAGA